MVLVDSPRDSAVLTAMILMTLADGHVVEDEVTRMRWLLGKVLDVVPTEEEVRAEIRRVREHPVDLEDFLGDVARQLTVEGKRRMLKAAFAIASADGRVLDEEDRMLVGIAKGLGIAPEDYIAVLGHLKLARELE